MADCAGRSGGCKGFGSTAVGYWGRDIYRRVLSEQEQERQRVLLQDELFAMGLRAELYVGVDTGNTCKCYKESAAHADRKCYTCHGVGKVPGYEKFGYTTFWMTSSDSDITLTNTEITTKFKSATIQLTEGQTLGTIESGDKAFTRSIVGSVWEYDVKYLLRDKDNSGITIEYSLNSGATWNNIATLITSNPSSGNIRFKVTLTRDSSSILSPFFEVIKARYARILTDGRWGPWIIVLNNKPFSRKIKSDWGDQPLQEGTNMWTTGLAMFDPDIEVGSREELISGPFAFVKILDGVLENERYAINSWQQSDPRGYLVLQNFETRYVDSQDPLTLVW
jgi:hypothetical protein